MKLSELIFIGIAGSIVALNRATGAQVWTTRLKGGNFVNVVWHEDRLLATTCGEVFCLEPLTGRIVWHNGLKGFGRGLAGIALAGMPANPSSTVMAEQQRCDEEAASAAATTAAIV
jgi:hypothetical protein